MIDCGFPFKPLMTGIIGGTVFFAGLWWTVRTGLTAAHPAMYFSFSLLLRAGLVMGCFYAVSAAGWQGLVLCAVGFLIARVCVTGMIERGNTERHAT